MTVPEIRKIPSFSERNRTMRKATAYVPYVPVVGFEKAIQAMKNAKVGDPLDKSQLERRGVSGNIYYQVVNALKFLKIIDKNKRITDNLQTWMGDRAGKLKIVQSAYRPLLQKLNLPAKENSAVKKGIKDLYQMADSVVLLATTFFTWAARQGGIDVLEGDMNGTPRRGRGAKPGLARRRSPRAARVAAFPIAGSFKTFKGLPPVVFNVNLQVSKETKKNDIRRMLADVKEELKNFA